jgi:hypothetical protein
MDSVPNKFLYFGDFMCWNEPSNYATLEYTEYYFNAFVLYF